jgi:hypothetical protein
VLAVGETRAVDNGHLVAWSASMKYRVGLAAGDGMGGMTGRRLMNSMTSGEGLMCFFEGPGIVYLQSHKPDRPGAGDRKRAGKQASGGPAAMCMVFLFMIVFFGIFFAIARQAQQLSTENDFKPRRRQQQNRGHARDYDNRDYGGREEF